MAKECKNNAIKGSQYLDKSDLLKSPFTLGFLDPSKCSSPMEIYGATKGTMQFYQQGAMTTTLSLFGTFIGHIQNVQAGFLTPRLLLIQVSYGSTMPLGLF